MLEEAKKILNKKHLLIIGKTAKERKEFISNLISISNLDTFRFKSGMKSFDEYCDFIKSKSLFSPWYESKSYNINQILDFHWDWLENNNSLLVMEEFDNFEERWQIELLRIYTTLNDTSKKGDKTVHVIITLESENNLLDKISEVITLSEKERRTKKQVVEQNLAIITL